LSNAEILYKKLLLKYQHTLAYAKRSKRLNRRLYNNYLKLKQYHNKTLKKAENQARNLLQQTIKEKYPLILDHRHRIIHVDKNLLDTIEMTQIEFASSFYIDLLFEKYLPNDFTNLGEILIPEFHFPILLDIEQPTDDRENNEDGISVHPFLHFGISGKRVYNKQKKLFIYFLSMRDISPEIELSYYQKTDKLIVSLSQTNLQLQQAQKTIEAQKIMLISLVCSLVEEHNRETSIHLQHIRLITSYITEECLRLNIVKKAPYQIEQYLKDIAYTSILHDIGKVRIPKDLIEKTQGLTFAEYAKIQGHTTAGAAYIKRIMNLFQNDPSFSQYIDFLMIPYTICLYHHERWDGKGYPKGLKGSEIPLPARIVSIADTYDAMRATRSYNIPMSHAEAVREIKKCSGTQFDPILVKVFLNIEKKLEEIEY